jgi:hypothetical protein
MARDGYTQDMKHVITTATALLAVACGTAEPTTPSIINVSSGPGFAALTRDAVATWNDALGQAVFVVVPVGGVHVEAFVACPESVAGRARAWQSGNKPLDGWIRLCAPYMAKMPAGYAEGALVHELGHVLGLPHESDAHSVMNATSPTDWELEAATVDAAIGNVATWHVGTQGL